MSDGMSDMLKEERDNEIRNSLYGVQILNDPSLKAGVYAQMDAKVKWEAKMLEEVAEAENMRLTNALDNQVGGSHYAEMTIQPAEFIVFNEIGFLEGNVIKYICRHQNKNGAEDIKKAIHYCELLLQLKYGD